ncbi:MAG TPA: hypothetical protein VHO46_04750 [Bacteroidales bacterium]|nr:hypothetical protein [Bacteroidales bacterium]
MKLLKSPYKSFLLLLFICCILYNPKAFTQPVPGKDENIPFLVTFGKDGKTSWGDDTFHSVWFFSIAKDYTRPFYIRIFDPDCGGEHDEIQGDFNSRTLFSVYGGKGVDPNINTESRGDERGVNFKKGNLLVSRLFSNDAKTDNKYYVFGPFNPTDGDFNPKWNSYIFKIVCEGVTGDDGNLYRYFLSSDPNNDIPVEGANAFTYKYIFRMWNDFRSVAHIYPYIDTGIISVKQSNFDWDADGKILVVSRYKQGIEVPISTEDNWVQSVIPVEPGEVNSSLDFQFIKRQGELVKNNNVVITTKNQRNEAMPFYSSPIGGVPVYVPKTVVQKLPPKK